MDRDLFLNVGPQFEPSSQPQWKPMTRMHSATDISQQNWENSDQFSHFESVVSNLPIMDHFVNENLPRIRNSMPLNPNLQLLAADPGFAERAAKFSCFGSRSFNEESNVSPVTAVGKFPSVSSNPAMKTDQSPVRVEEKKHLDETNMKLSRLSTSAANSNEESSVSNPKRKRVSTAKKAEEQTDESKRAKKIEREETKLPEPPKDYIHVRARRGQATDSHSLAERVRRERISERMKLLQNLVPNCNKVTGKALMLDEIINYVQSLQRQVEFLSMKLATVDFATNDLMSQNINPSNRNLCQDIPSFYQQELFNGSALTLGLTQSVHEFTEHFRRFSQDDLQSIVRMGFNQHLDLDTSFFHTTMDQLSGMKPSSNQSYCI